MTPQRTLDHHVNDLIRPVGFGRIVDETAEALLALGRVPESPHGLTRENVHTITRVENAFERYKQWCAHAEKHGELTRNLALYANDFGIIALRFAREVADEHGMQVYGSIHLTVPGAIPAPHMNEKERARYDGLCNFYNVEPLTTKELVWKDKMTGSFVGQKSEMPRVAEVVLRLEPGYSGSVSQLLKYFADLPTPRHMHYADLTIDNEMNQGYRLQANMNEMRLSPLYVPVAPRVYELFEAIPQGPLRKAA